MAGEEDRERRQEELEALEAIYGEAFTLGEFGCREVTSAVSQVTVWNISNFYNKGCLG